MAVANLNEEKGKKFLRLLSDEAFVCVVVTDDELRIFSKGMDGEQLERIRQNLSEIEGA